MSFIPKIKDITLKATSRHGSKLCILYKRHSQQLGAAQTEVLRLLLGTAELDDRKNIVTGERLQV
jgi:hypothetical protein